MLSFGVGLVGTVSYTQEFRRREIDPTSFVQNLLPITAEDLNYDTVYENLIQLYTAPLDLNTCTREELAATYLLNERQLNRFFEYRNQLGTFLSIYELQAIPEFDLPLIYRLLPFVTVTSSNQKIGKGLTNPTDHYFLVRTERLLEQKRGATAEAPQSRDGTLQKFTGSPLQWYARYRYNRSRDFSFGITAEKDEGEAFSWKPSGHKYGPDFLSFHAQVQHRGHLKNLILGDYQLQVGQGLIYSAGFSLGKGIETVYTIRRPTTGIRPYTSVTETGFFRGIAATYSLSKHLELTALLARVRQSGTLTVQQTISSFQTDGLFRIPNELQYRANLVEQNAGAHLAYHLDRGQLGATYLHTSFDYPLQKAEALRNAFEFRGKHNHLLGLYGNYVWQNFHFFGETARSKSGGTGTVAGVLTSLTKRWDASLLFRNFDKNFHSFYANAFGENSRNINETGLYLGVKYSVHKRLKLTAYVDLYRFPWYKYLVDKQPTSGFDFLLQSTWTPSKQWTLYAVFRQEQKEKNIASDLSKQKFVTQTLRRNLVFNAEYNHERSWSFRSRIQGGTFGYDGFKADKGWLVLQEITAKWSKISTTIRVSAYNTDSYDTRQYAVEQDVLYAISMPAYYERGFRHFFLLRYSATNHSDIWFRISRTSMPERDVLSSYVDEIQGSKRTDIKLQLRYRF